MRFLSERCMIQSENHGRARLKYERLRVTSYMLPVTCYFLHTTCYFLLLTCYLLLAVQREATSIETRRGAVGGWAEVEEET